MRIAWFLSCICVCSALGPAAFGQNSVISSFDHNGLLTCQGLAPNSIATVEWASTPNGPWTNTWAALTATAVDSNGVLIVRVPMYYRVKGEPPVVTPQDMVLIPAGSFRMGDNLREGDGDETPVHTVHVSAFYVDRYEVTKALWDEVKTYNGGNGYRYSNLEGGKSSNHPVHTVSWYDCVKWANARSEKDGLIPVYYTDAGFASVYRTGEVEPYANGSANGYRLPTEAEWEKAARGGASGQRFPWGTNIDHDDANYKANGSAYTYDASPYTSNTYHPDYDDVGYPYTSPVGSFGAQGYGDGLYDMAGNLWEWCWDRYQSSWYDQPGAVQDDTKGPSSGPNRVRRGGAWHDRAAYCRIANRRGDPPGNSDNGMGFRVVLSSGQ